MGSYAVAAAARFFSRRQQLKYCSEFLPANLPEMGFLIVYMSPIDPHFLGR
jgi:hypothetical protein